MATERLQIIIEALNQSADELNELQGDLEGVERTSRKGEGNMFDMRDALRSLAVVAGTATAAFFALKKGLDFAKEGAQLELIETKFDRLAGSIGTTSEALREDLSEATQGLMSDAETMKSATDLMALGLAKNHEEAVRLTNVASQLGMNMNQLVLTLTNQTTMRFDALGVAVDGFDKKVQKLEESGIATNEAFKLAFLEQAEEQIEKVGSVADTAAGEIAKMEAEWSNYMDSIKKKGLRILLPGIKHTNRMNEAIEELDKAEEQGIITSEEANRVRSLLNRNMIDAAGIMDTLEQRRKELDLAGQRNAQTLDLERRKMEEAAVPAEILSRKMEGLTIATDEAGKEMNELAEPLSGLPEDLQLSVDALRGGWIPAWSEAYSSVDKTLRHLELIQARMESIARTKFAPIQIPVNVTGNGADLMLGGKLFGGGQGGQFGGGINVTGGETKPNFIGNRDYMLSEKVLTDLERLGE